VKKHLLIFSCFVLLTQYGVSQSWAPIGATWYYRIHILVNAYTGFIKFQSVGDTLINGKICSVIKYVDGNWGYCSLPGDLHEVYTYSDSGRVFVYDSVNNGFSLVYDFSLDTGQTYVSVWDSCSYQRTISNTDSINLNGNWHRRYRLMETNLWSYIENIGGAEIFLPCLIEYTCTNIIVDADYISGIRCYYDSTIGFIDFDTAHACDYATGIHEPSIGKLFSAFPNPATNFINITNNFSSPMQIIIFSAYGTVVHQTNLAKDAGMAINASRWSNGIYLVTAQSGKNFISRKIIKQ